MAAENEVLGISGQLDITDIETTINKLLDSLEKIGVDTSTLSSRVTASLQEIANSADKDLGQKLEAGLEVLKSTIGEANTALAETPKMLDNAQQAVERYTAACEKLSTQRESTVVGSGEYDAISAQLRSNQQALALAKEDLNDLTQAYHKAQEAVGNMGQAMEWMSTIHAASATVSQADAVITAENIGAKTGNAVATGVEAAAHAANSEEIGKENTAKIANATATEEATCKVEEHTEAVQRDLQVEEMQSRSLKELKEDLKVYEQGLAEINSTLQSGGFEESIAKEEAQIERSQKKLEKYIEAKKEYLANDSSNPVSDEGVRYFDRLIEQQSNRIEEAKQKIASLRHEQEKLTNEQQRYSYVINETKKAISTYDQRMKDASKSAKNVGAETAKGFSEAKGGINSFGDAVKEGKVALGSFTTAASGSASGLLGLATGAASAVTVIGAVAGVIAYCSQQAQELYEKLLPLNTYIEDDTLGQLRQKFVEQEQYSTKSAEELAGAAMRWVKAYDDIRDSSEAIEDVVNASKTLSAVTGTEVEKTAKTLSSLGKIYHQTAREATENVNVIVNAAHESTASYDEMMQALMSSAPRANAAGVSLKELASILAVGSKAFGSVSTASSNLSMILMRLSQDTIPQQFNPSIVGATTALQNLNEYVKNGGNLQTYLGARAAKNGLIFVENADQIAELTGRLDDNSVVQQELANKEEMVGTHTKRLGTAWGGLVHTLDANFSPALIAVIDLLAGVVNGFGEVFGAINRVLGGLADFDTWVANHTGGISIGNGLRWGWNALGSGWDWAKRNLNDRAILTGWGLWGDYDPNGNVKQQKTDTNYWNDQAQRAERQRKEQEERERKANTHNKAYWQGKKSDAQNQLAALDESKKGTEEWNKYVKEIQEADKHLKTYNLSASNKETAKQQKQQLQEARQAAQQREKVAEETRRWEEKQRQYQRDAAYAQEQARIDGMKEGSEKSLASLDLEHKKRLDQIQQQEEEYRQEAYDNAKKLWDADPKHKTSAFSDSHKVEDYSLTDDQQKIIDAQRQSEALNYEQKQKKIYESLISDHQSYIDQKIAIDKKYREDILSIDAAIREATKRGDNKTVEALERSRIEATKQRSEAQANLTLEELRKTPEYVRAFEDLGNTSAETLEYLISEFEKAKEAAARTLDPEKLREYTSTLQQMYDELNARNPFEALSKATREAVEAQQELMTAQSLYDMVKKGIKVPSSYQMNADGKIEVSYLTEETALKRVLAAKDKYNKATNQQKKALAEVTSSIDELANAIVNIGNSIGGLAGEILGAIGGVMNFTTTTISGIQQLAEISAKSISSTLKAIESASVILAIASAAVSLVKTVTSILPTTDDFYAKAAQKQRKINDLRDAVHQYRLAVLEAEQSERNWFATSSLGELTDSYMRHGEIVKAYYDKLYEEQEIYQNKASGLSKAIVPIAVATTAVVAAAAGVVSGGLGAAAVGALGSSLIGSTAVATAVGVIVDAAAGAIVGAAINAGISALSYDEGKTSAMNNLRIQTQHRSFWRGEKTEDLQSWLNKQKGFENARLFDENGLANKELIDTILNKWGDKLVGETKETLEALRELRDKYDEFIAEVDEYVSNMYSPLVDNLTDALFDWLTNGEDVLDKFREYANDTFANVAKDMVRQMVITTLFKPLQDQLEALTVRYAASQATENPMSIQTLADETMDAFDAFMDRTESQIPSLQELISYIDSRMSESGISLTRESTTPDKKATYNSLEKWTYEQADELINRATAMQIIEEHLYEQAVVSNETQRIVQQDVAIMKGDLSFIRVDINSLVEIQQSSNEKLERIVVNTSPISEIRDLVKKLYNER